MVTVTELVEDWRIVCVISAAQWKERSYSVNMFLLEQTEKKENLLQNNYLQCTPPRDLTGLDTNFSTY